MKRKITLNLFLIIGISIYAVLCNAESKAVYTQKNKNPMDIGVTALFAAGGANKGNSTISSLQGGKYDPAKIGFSLQTLEFAFAGSVDPYFDAQTNIVMLFDKEGDSILEIEEAYLVSKQLPGGLQIKAGQFYTEFGRQNVLHPHAWAFVDQPIVSSRLLGSDGLRSQGARVSWLSPLPWYSELFLGVQNAQGATGNSFLSFGHSPEADRAANATTEYSINGLEDFIYSARWLNRQEINKNISAKLGFSGVKGPNANGINLGTVIYGADLSLKWQAAVNSRGFPFVALHAEFLHRDYEESQGADVFTRKDNGWFSQISYGFKPGWIAGLRLEMADSNEEANNAIDGDERFRTSLNLTWLRTEFSKLRLQYNYDHAHHIGEDVHLLWLQFEYKLGSHAAHVF